MSGTTFTLAHLTDIHLGPITGFQPRYWNTKRVLGYANWRRTRRDAFRRDTLDAIVADLQTQVPDHIIVTGDLINIGLPAEMIAARRWLETLGSPATVSLIPGNHDIYTSMRGDPGVARWHDYMGGGSDFPYVRRFGRVALIGLNSAVETKPFDAGGELGAAQRNRLSGLLDTLGADDAIRIVAIHHPPLPGQATPSRGLRDAAALAELLATHGAELVIHGHNHRNMRGNVAHDGRMIAAVGLASASLAVAHPREHLARYNLYRVTASASAIEITVIGRGLAEPGGRIVEVERTRL